MGTFGRIPATPYQAIVRTSRPRTAVLDDLAALDVPGTRVDERGDTYLVFSSRPRGGFGAGRATAVAIAAAIVILLLTALHVLWIIFLPAVLLAYVPLLLDDHPMLAVGAVDEPDGVTCVTVHGSTWGELGAGIDAYTSHLPTPEASAPAAPAQPAGVGAAAGHGVSGAPPA